MANGKDLATVERVPGQVEAARSGRTYVPHVDILEKPEELLLLADVPGTRAEDVDIDYEKGALTIHGRVNPRVPEGSHEFLVQEYGVGDFHRVFQVGEGIDPKGIRAEVKNGVLTLTLPKHEAARPRKITVRNA